MNNTEDLMQMLNLQNMNILQQNKQVPFVDRVLNPRNYPSPSIFDDAGRMQTHFMSATPDKDGNWFAYPNIVFENGKYRKVNKNEDEALAEAIKNKNVVSFGKDKNSALNFSKNYEPLEFKEYYKGLLQE